MKWNEYFDVRAGVLIHKPRVVCPNSAWNSRYGGKPAGCIRPDGYVRVKFNRKAYYAHVIVFEMFFGEVPKGFDIDHVDRNKSNNRPMNLRLASRSENKFNAPAYVTNKLGVRGVSYHKRVGKFAAGIRVDGKSIHIGYFDDVESANIAYSRYASRVRGVFANAVE